jgi:hypothetical protein
LTSESGFPQIDPIAVHRENIKILSPRDILIPAYPGSGHALLGNVLLELGLNYSDPYTEQFENSGQSQPLDIRTEYRRRLAATAAKDAQSVREGSARFVKTHLYPQDFPIRHQGVVLLVRDPRDAIHSYYRWRLGFSEEGESGSFEEFLDRAGPNGVPPDRDWIQFHSRWLGERDRFPNFLILRFEDLKQRQEQALEPFLRLFAPEIDLSRVIQAFEASSFPAMRAHEDRVSTHEGHKRIMRRGIVNEWHEWFHGRLSERFLRSALPDVAPIFGYCDWPDRSDR